MTSDKVMLAAWNNAMLCDSVCKSHGMTTTVTECLWICHGAPPRFYPSAATLKADAQSSISAEKPRHGFKDGFHDIDGTALGYHELFEAQWIWLTAPSIGKTILHWERVETDAYLQTWENRWATGDSEASGHPRQFPPTLLLDSSLAFMAGVRNGIIEAGCVLNLTDPVVGLSNQFGDAWHDYPQVIAKIHPNKSAVGYERGDSLKQALATGFEAIGPLSVWLPQTQP